MNDSSPGAPETPDSAPRESDLPWLYLLKVTVLCAVPLVPIGLVAGNADSGLAAAPAFILVLGAEVYRTLRGSSFSRSSLRWVGVTILPPLAFAIPTAMSIRVDPTVPQTALFALVFLLPLLTLIAYAILVGVDRWLRSRSTGVRWGGLSALGLLLGAILPLGLVVRGEIQDLHIQNARQDILNQARTLNEQWALEMQVSDLASASGNAMVRSGNSILTVDPNGKRGQVTQLSRPGLPFLDSGQLDADPRPEMIVHGKGFTDTLRAFDDDGHVFWNYATSQGTVGSVALADVTSDGRTEVVAGSMTGGGVRMLTSTGQTLWADTTLSVTDVAARPPTETDSAAVVVATGKTLEVYRQDGTHARSLHPSASSSNVTLGMSPDQTGPTLFVGADRPTLEALSLDGTVRWCRPLPASGASLMAKGQHLAVVGDDQGRIYIFDAETGRPIATSSSARSYRGAEWLPQEDKPPVLLGWTDDRLVRLTLPNPQARMPPSASHSAGS